MTGPRLAVEVITFGSRGFLGSKMLTSQSISIGRDPDAMIRLEDPSVSLKHAVLFLVGDAYYIKDLGSRTGTRVNGAPASPLTALTPTDEIEIGSFRLRVTVHRPPSMRSERPASAELHNPTPYGAFAPARALAPLPSDPGETDEPTAIHKSQRPEPPDQEPTNIRVPAPIPAAGMKPPAADTNDVDGLLAHAGILDDLLAKAGALSDAGAAAQARGSLPTVQFQGGVAMPPPQDRPAPPPSPMGMPKTVPLSWMPVQTPGPVPVVPEAGPPERRPPPEHRPPPPAASPAHTPLLPPPSRGPISANPPAASAVSSSPMPAQHALSRGQASAPPARAPVDRGPGGLGGGLLGAPIAAPHAREDHDDDDDDDENFVPQFDLLEAMSQRGLRADDARKREAVVEVIRYRRDRVISVRHLTAKRGLRLPGAKVVIGRAEADGSFALDTRAAGVFAVRQGGRDLSTREAELLAAGGKLGLAPGMQITVDVRGEDKLLIHLVARAAPVPRPAVSLRIDKERLTSGVSSAMFHLAVLGLVGVMFLEKARDASDLNEGRFATIALKEIELEPPPPPPPEVVPTAEAAMPTKAPSTPQPTSHTKATPAPKNAKTASKASEPAAEQPAAATSKILSSLGATAPTTLTATAITNLDAAPRAAGGFKVSGAIGKAPGDSLRVAAAGSGSGTLDTKSATEIGAAKVGRVEGQKGTGQVRARVTAIPQAIRGEGHLDRGEIQRVVNAHMHQVQGCYERQLMKDPSLGGKVTLEWVIELSGGVSSVRVKQSTLHSTEVASCIQGAIQGWRFPTPQGGSVTVTYPFAFSTLGN